MKKTFNLFASLTLGLMVASCQNGLEEVINESAVQDELATTRAEIETPVDEEIIEEYAVGPTIFGPTIICDTSEKLYSVTPPSNCIYAIWSCNTNVFNIVDDSHKEYLRISLLNVNSIANETITATFYDAFNNVISVSRIYVGMNGPHPFNCSLRVLRSSDGIEVYPSSVYMEPYTYYYAFFDGVSNITLDWQFTYTNYVSTSGSTAYFQTGDSDFVLLNLYGKMSGSTIWKQIFGLTIY